jgi:hypothetical protein
MEFLKGTAQVMQQAEAGGGGDQYAYVATELVQAKNRVREAIEQTTAPAITAIIPKLENHEPLSEEEKQTIKLWVVGDAAGYVKMENNFTDWLEEYRRLMGAVAAYEDCAGSVEDLVEIHGVLEDAIKVSDALAHYLDDRERVARFESAITQLNAEDSKFIAGILKSMLSSPDL